MTQNTTSREERFNQKVSSTEIFDADGNDITQQNYAFIESEINSLLDELLSEGGNTEVQLQENETTEHALGRSEERARWRAIINHKKQV